jgi:hypothetical protein
VRFSISWAAKDLGSAGNTPAPERDRTRRIEGVGAWIGIQITRRQRLKPGLDDGLVRPEILSDDTPI